MEKVFYSIEYDFGNVSPARLWNLITSADGLSTWFADRVEIDERQFSFYWDNEKRNATRVSIKNESSLKLRWNDDSNKKHFFEFKIVVGELTKNITLVISDFANKNEIEESINLWNEQIAVLGKILGVNPI